MPAYIAAVQSAGGDPSGFPTPSWSPEAAMALMDKFGTAIGVLSISSPGVPIAGTGPVARQFARALNLDLGSHSTNSTYHGRLGFFGALPDWRDVNGTLAEIDFLYGQQRLCAGVTVYTSHGDMLPGNASFQPIWDALQRHKALVFGNANSVLASGLLLACLEPRLPCTQGVLDVTPEFLGNGFPQPILEYPLATTRAAVDLMVGGTLASHPDVDVILSHAGGALPYLAQRILAGLAAAAVGNTSRVTAEEAREDLGRFYLDTAVSTSAAQLDGMLDFTNPERILHGSDFPYFAESDIRATIDDCKAFVRTSPRGFLITPSVLRSNAAKLLAQHSQAHRFA